MIFFKTKRGFVICVDAIQLISPKICGSLWETKSTDMSSSGMAFVKDIFDENELKSKFGMKRVAHCGATFVRCNKQNCVFGDNDIVGYVCHLSIPNGGINHNHVTVNISVEEYNALTDIIQKHGTFIE